LLTGKKLLLLLLIHGLSLSQSRGFRLSLLMRGKLRMAGCGHKTHQGTDRFAPSQCQASLTAHPTFQSDMGSTDAEDDAGADLP
jgi:hypothetical protein